MKAAPALTPKLLWLSVAGLGLAQIATNISNKVSIDAYTERLSFFQAQFMNVAYVVFGVPMMLWMQHTGSITADERKWYFHWTYFSTGVLDSLAVLTIAVGGNNTPGDWQTVIS